MKHVVTFLKFAAPLAIIVWLLSSIDPAQREALWLRDKNWGLLAIAFATVLAAVCITFVRWYVLVRTLGLRFRLRDAFRLGFLAYLLNFVSLGSVGGDLFKAVFIAREQPGRRTEAVATVIVDRLVGLYALLLLTSTALLLVETPDSGAVLTAISNATFLATVLCTAGVGLATIPALYQGRFARWLTSLPKVGSTIGKVIESLHVYRKKRLAMLLTLALGISVHALLAIGTFFVAAALFTETPTTGEHFLIVPLSNVAGSLPFMPNGLGSFEFAMRELYKLVPVGGPGDVLGVLVALTYRMITLAIAAVGIAYYWACRKEVRQLLREAESVSENEMDTAAAAQSS